MSVLRSISGGTNGVSVEIRNVGKGHCACNGGSYPYQLWELTINGQHQRFCDDCLRAIYNMLRHAFAVADDSK